MQESKTPIWSHLSLNSCRKACKEVLFYHESIEQAWPNAARVLLLW